MMGGITIRRISQIRAPAMRTTLSTDDDILAAARQLAEREQSTIGEVISNLARQGLSRSGKGASAERNGIPLLPGKKGAVPVALERVNELRDELAWPGTCSPWPVVSPPYSRG
jgi:hypothetical protein